MEEKADEEGKEEAAEEDEKVPRGQEIDCQSTKGASRGLPAERGNKEQTEEDEEELAFWIDKKPN